MANLRVRARRRPEDYVSNRNISNIFEEVIVLDKLIFVVPTKLRITSYELSAPRALRLAIVHQIIPYWRANARGTFYFVIRNS